VNKPQFFDAPHGSRIAYHHHQAQAITVVFFGGFMSDMEGSKATALEAHCQVQGYGYLRFDYSGHGQSAGKFEDGTIGLWARDAISLIEEVTDGPLLFIGSSMGGWTSLLAALHFGDRVQAWMGIAPAPDFTETLMWAGFSEATKEKLMRDGQVELPSDYSDAPYIITRALIEDGRDNLLLNGPLKLDIPLRMIHGVQDKDVPVQVSHDIMARAVSNDVELVMVKNGGHSLSEPHDLRRLCNMLDDLLDQMSD